MSSPVEGVSFANASVKFAEAEGEAEPNSSSESSSADRVRLTFQSINGETKVVDVPGHVDFLTIGRSRNCIISFPRVAALSLTHCHITREETARGFKYTIKDCNTTNGMCVNGVSLSKNGQIELKNGSLVGMVRPDCSRAPYVNFTFTILKTRKRRSSRGGIEFVGEVVRSGTRIAPIMATTAVVVENGAGTATSPLTLAPTVVIEEGKTKYPSKKRLRQAEEELQKRDTLGSALQCTICLEVYHNPVILCPCAHRFCAGCFSILIGPVGSPNFNVNCPNCRSQIDSFMKDIQTREVVEGYLKYFPAGRQSDEHRYLLDKADHITPRPGNHYTMRSHLNQSRLYQPVLRVSAVNLRGRVRRHSGRPR